MPLNAIERRSLEIYDEVGAPRRVVKAVSVRPDRFGVKLMSSSVCKPADNAKSQVLVGRVEIVAKTNQSGPIDGEVQVFMEGKNEPSNRVEVIGQVLPEFVVVPSSVILPRETAEGPVYSATCLCRSTGAKRFELSVEEAPTGIAVRVLPGTDSRPAWTVLIERRLEEDIGQTSLASAGSIRLRARSAHSESLLEIPVYVTAPGGSK
jgi:hypothetical protein